MAKLLAVLVVLVAVAQTSGLKLTSNFYNMPPKADPPVPMRKSYLSWSNNNEAWRMQNAIHSQGQDVTKAHIFGKEVITTKVTCPTGTPTGTTCLSAVMTGGPTFTEDEIMADKNAFVNLVTKLINMGLMMPNRVFGQNPN